MNGIALGVLELKRSTISVAEGIRQNLDNQKKVFIEPFFSTIQWVMAGNDTEGLRYGTIQTPERHYLTWKEPSEVEDALDRALVQLCGRDRFLEPPLREMVSGESHYYLGRRYRLRVVFSNGPAGMQPRGRTVLELRVRRGSSAAQRLRVLERWYRERLRDLLPPLLAKWQPILGLRGVRWGIRKMKTKWGACSLGSRRVWLNLELAKAPAVCLEYVAVHELAHLRERRHNDRFVALLDQHLPQWRLHRQTLNAAPLGHASWKY